MECISNGNIPKIIDAIIDFGDGSHLVEKVAKIFDSFNPQHNYIRERFVIEEKVAY